MRSEVSRARPVSACVCIRDLTTSTGASLGFTVIQPDDAPRAAPAHSRSADVQVSGVAGNSSNGSGGESTRIGSERSDDNDRARERAGHHDFPMLACMFERLDEHLDYHRTASEVRQAKGGELLQWFDAP